jgi:hypothetical protein
MKCVNCGEPLDALKYPCHDEGVCFDCYFWGEKVPFVNNPSSVRVEGTHYWIGEETADQMFRGFAGRKFHVLFNDGREVITTNLWCQGDIPERWRKELPDNAVFVEG